MDQDLLDKDGYVYYDYDKKMVIARRMKKKLILVASPPACGKTYVSELLAKSLGQVVYLDKDDLSDIVRKAFVIGNQKMDMDGEFYINNIRECEYSTILNIAFSSLRFNDCVILNAPFGKEVRNVEFMRSLKNRANQISAELVLIWISVDKEVCFERMKKRNSDRDYEKIKNWQEYSSKINYNPPLELETESAVSNFILFKANDKKETEDSLIETLKILRK